MTLIVSPSEELAQAYEMTGEPDVIPQYNLKLRLMRAGLGLLCLLSAASACVSFLALVILESPLGGLVFGVSGILFWLAIRVGGTLSPPEPEGDWGTVLEQTEWPD